MAATTIPQPVTMEQVKELTSLMFQSVCPNNEILFDDLGAPSVMVKIPVSSAKALLGSENTHPAFTINGQSVNAVYISKYQNIVKNGRAYSLPAQGPQGYKTFDEARAACEAKGAGWHLMTRAEWALLALWCKANGTIPKGNTNYGKDAADPIWSAIPLYIGGNTVYGTYTGTGPVSWSHDGTLSGIWDLNGNYNEMVGGLRTVYGELQILADNNAADSSNSQAADSAQWKAIKASDGTLITPNGSGTTTGSIKIDWVSNHAQYDTSITDSAPGDHEGKFEEVTCSANIGNAAKLLLQKLALFKYDDTSGAYGQDVFYMNNAEAERLFNCGENLFRSYGAGVFAVNGKYGRTMTDNYLGFRSAYVEIA